MRSLLSAARRAMSHALPHVSGYRVGAALRTATGEVFTGVNVESPSLLQVFCAERVALLKALSEGQTAFTHIAVVAEQSTPATPCGLCRQMLHEFAAGIVVVTEDQDGTPLAKPLADYLPEAFDGP
ncbi:MAG: cytidine deaminase [Candidatus Lernaella stagnicola]|nr:cytidine deaminase [Candidatus Lernaella stagnicola]